MSEEAPPSGLRQRRGGRRRPRQDVGSASSGVKNNHDDGVPSSPVVRQWLQHLGGGAPVRVRALRAQARSQGLECRALRMAAWHKLVQVNMFTDADKAYAPWEVDDAAVGSLDSGSEGEVEGVGTGPPAAKFTHQIRMDVKRSMWQFDVCQAFTAAQRRTFTRQLFLVLDALFRKHPEAHYYQGMHDVGTVILLVTDARRTFFILERLMATHLRGFVSPTLDISIGVLKLLYPLVEEQDGQLHAFVQKAKLEPFFALPWVLTWFAHDLRSLHDAARLFDLFLSSHPLLPLYMCAAVLLWRREAILGSSGDASELHGMLQRLPVDAPIDKLVDSTLRMFRATPPKALIAKTPQAQLLVKQWPHLQSYPYEWMSSYCAADATLAGGGTVAQQPGMRRTTGVRRWADHRPAEKVLVLAAVAVAGVLLLAWLRIWLLSLGV